MKKIFVIFSLLLLVANSTFAAGSKEKKSTDYSPGAFYKEIKKELGRDILDYEQNIVDSTYLYYYTKFEKNWNNERWEEAKSTALKLCFNKAAIIASKTGMFGEKFIQAIIVSAGDVKNSFESWLETNSDRYEKSH